MNNVLESFVTLEDNVINHLNIKNSFSASYSIYNNNFQLNLEKLIDDSEEYYLSPSDDNYSITKNDLCIRGCVNVENIGCLFGKESEYSRIALDDTVIGVSLNAYSIASKRNVTKPIGEFSVSDDQLSIIYDISFPVGALADKLFVSINLYVKNAKRKSSIFASIDGTILGNIYSAVINLEGAGSIFPIRVVASDNEPLWYVDLNYADLNDAFCQNNLCLNINSSHNDFDKIGSQDITLENKTMWKQILASFFSQIIISLNDNEKNDLYQDDTYVDGSIGLFLQYIIKNFNIDRQVLDNPVLLNKKIMVRLDEIVK